MSFEFEIGDLSNVNWEADEYWVEFTVGFDLDSEERVSMVVALIEDSEGGADPFTLNFGLLIRGIYSGSDRGPYFDHETCRQYVSQGNAPAVMKLILDAISNLVEDVNPQEIAMFTYETFLPAPAMEKYYKIVSQLEQCGFKTTSYQRDGTDGKDRWYFEK